MRSLCAQLQYYCRLADRGGGSVCQAPRSALLAIAHGSWGCRMKGARTRWGGVGKDWALGAPLRPSQPARAGGGAGWCCAPAPRGGGGRHT